MKVQKSSRNKTIALSLEEGQGYLSRCLRPSGPMGLEEILDKTLAGDSLSLASLLPRGFVHLMVADPPYNLDKDFHGGRFARVSDEAYLAYTLDWLERMRPLLREDASVYVCCDWRCSGIVAEALSRHFILRNRITWQREKGRGAKRNWKNAMEDIWFATCSSRYTFNLEAVKQRRRVVAPYRREGRPKDWRETGQGRLRDTCPSNFWDDISIPYWSMAENTAHPTQKPEKLLAKLILASSNAGEVVFDPFLGSGSTSVAACKLGRRYVGIEQNERYCVWAEKRLEMARQDSSIQGYADGVFWERNTLALQQRYR